MSEAETNPVVEVLTLVHGSTRVAATKRAESLTPSQQRRVLAAFAGFRDAVLDVETDPTPETAETPQ